MTARSLAAAENDVTLPQFRALVVLAARGRSAASTSPRSWG
ncbi:hypothetical protein AB0368_04490 [Actinoplanes sp. NPDC051475]